MKIYRFNVKIENNTFAFKSEAHKNMFQRWLQQWEGKEVGIEVIEKKPKRTEQQNRYYWMYLSLIESETGNKKKALHALFSKRFLTEEITELYGDKVRVTKSTTELSVGEFCEYLIDISTITQVELPDTEEYFGYSYHKR